MNYDLPTLTAAALGGTLLASLLISWAVSARARRQLERRLEALEADLVTVRADLANALGLGSRVGDRVRRLEQVASQLGDRLGQIELRGDGRPFDHAIAMVRGGADAERLVSHFGLSQGEADLVSLVHGARRRAG
jgi:hypothetical protein